MKLLGICEGVLHVWLFLTSVGLTTSHKTPSHHFYYAPTQDAMNEMLVKMLGICEGVLNVWLFLRSVGMLVKILGICEGVLNVNV